MTIKTTTRTINTNGKTIKISLERGTWEEQISLDGMICGTKTHLVNRTEIAVFEDGKKVSASDSLKPLPARHSQLDQAKKAGCTGIIGNNWFVKADTADAISQALAEVEAENPKTVEMITLEQAEDQRQQSIERAMDQAEAERRERESHFGWCKLCEDYTYGDCGHH